MSFISSGLVVVVLAAVWTVSAKAQQAPDFIKLGEIIQRCRQETGATNEDIQSIFLRKIPETRSGQCMLACSGQELGLMRDGALDAEGTLAMAGRLLQGRDERIQEAVRSAILTCAEYSASAGSQDSCEAAAQLASCGIDQAQRVSTATRRAQEELKPRTVPYKTTYNDLQEGYFAPSQQSHSMKYLHSKTSYNQPPNHRVRRQSQLQPQSTYPNQNQPPNQPQNQPQNYPNQQYPNQYQNPPLGTILDPTNPYNYQTQPYVQPVVYTSPIYTSPVRPLAFGRKRRSPQEVVLTSTEIVLPPEAAAQLSERLRQLLLALISSQDELSSNSTSTNPEAEVIESITRAPRKRRDQPNTNSNPNNQDSPLGQILGRVRETVLEGPIHQLVQTLRNEQMTNSTMMNSTTNTPPAMAG